MAGNSSIHNGMPCCRFATRMSEQRSVLVVLLVLSIFVFAPFRVSAELKLADKLEKLNSFDLQILLENAGYRHVNLGERKEGTAQETAEPKRASPGSKKARESLSFPTENHVGHSCFPVDMNMRTMLMQNKSIVTIEDVVRPLSFVETDSGVTNGRLRNQKTMLKAQSGGKVRSSAAKDLDNPDLDCECKPYTCHCLKQCFCRLSADPFQGTHFPPEANCPICPVCSGAPKKKPDQEEKTRNIEQDFKCSCGYEGVGGPGISEGGYMECDCKVADCTCEKDCQCTKKRGSGMKFKETSSGPLHFKEKQSGVKPRKNHGPDNATHSLPAEANRDEIYG